MSFFSFRDKICKKIRVYAEFIKFSHSLFAFPFALSMGVLSLDYASVSIYQILYICLALVFARSAAMSFNRVIDAAMDAQNERTLNREIPAGIISQKEGWIFFGVHTLLFIFMSYLLSKECALLSPIVLFIILGYSYTKRFTSYCHLVLGLGLSLAPGGVWFALTNTFSLIPIPLMLGVLFWVSGFDMLYSCQDENFDRENGYYSFPVRLGIKNTFFVSKILHGMAVVFLILNGMVFSLGSLYYCFIALFAFFLVKQHLLITPDDLTQIDAAFFTQNGIASFLFFIGVVFDRFLFL